MDNIPSFLVACDLPTPYICNLSPPEQATDSESPEDNRLCLAFIILLIFNAYLLYLYLRSVYKIQKAKKYHKSIHLSNPNKMDRLDKWLIILSMMRILLVIAGVVSSEQYDRAYAWANPLLMFIWQVFVMGVFLKFMVEGNRLWKYLFRGFWVLYFLYVIVFANYLPLRAKSHEKV